MFWRVVGAVVVLMLGRCSGQKCGHTSKCNDNKRDCCTNGPSPRCDAGYYPKWDGGKCLFFTSRTFTCCQRECGSGQYVHVSSGRWPVTSCSSCSAGQYQSASNHKDNTCIQQPRQHSCDLHPHLHVLLLGSRVPKHPAHPRELHCLLASAGDRWRTSKLEQLPFPSNTACHKLPTVQCCASSVCQVQRCSSRLSARCNRGLQRKQLCDHNTRH